MLQALEQEFSSTSVEDHSKAGSLPAAHGYHAEEDPSACGGDHGGAGGCGLKEFVRMIEH